MREFIEESLAERLVALQLPCTSVQIQQLTNYLLLLKKWNKAFNLTAIRRIEDMLEKHLIDSLSIAPFILESRILDVGTGPGLPGIPLAILYPEKELHLLDSNGKKTRFLHQAKLEIGLKNVDIHNERVEHFQFASGFEAIISRAFASLSDMLGSTSHLLAAKGTIYAMKGQYPHEEIAAIDRPLKVESVCWPGNESARHLVIIQSSGE